MQAQCIAYVRRDPRSADALVAELCEGEPIGPGEHTQIECLCWVASNCFYFARFDLGRMLLSRLPDVEADALPPALRGTIATAQHFGANDIDGARHYVHLAYDAFSDAGCIIDALDSLNSLATLEADLGQFEEAETMLIQVRDELSKLGLTRRSMGVAADLAMLYYRTGRIGPTLAQAEVVEGKLAQLDDARASTFAIALRGAACAALGRLDEARAEIGRALALDAGASDGHAFALSLQSGVALAGGDLAGALQASEAALNIALERGFTISQHSAFVRLRRVEALLAAGLDAEARATLRDARSWLEGIASTIRAPGLRQSFCERVPENARLFALARQHLAEPERAAE
jgi:tetratricopeptide (TPR) repeat protein